MIQSTKKFLKRVCSTALDIKLFELSDTHISLKESRNMRSSPNDSKHVPRGSKHEAREAQKNQKHTREMVRFSILTGIRTMKSELPM